MAIGYRLSAIGYRLSAIGYRLSAISYQLSAISYQLSAISYRATLAFRIYTAPPPLTPPGYAPYCIPMQHTERFGFFFFTTPGGASPSGRGKR
jgi:hypothetical protein